MGTLSDIAKALKSVVTLADDLQRYHAEIKEIRQQLRDLTIVVNGLKQEIEHSKDRAVAERKNLLLELENNILRFEQRLQLPPTKENEEK
jgi:ABC-type transporter Mla subunit MlaD